jgi:DNA-binding CsgD family transcriptional regulator
MTADRFESLSDLEKEALRLFLVSSDQKEVARRIDRSPATVEQRLARARRKLGVARSLDAALMLADHEGKDTYGAAIYGPSLRGGEASPTLNLWPPKGHDGREAYTFFPTRGRPWNSLPIWLRLVMIVGGMLALLIAIAATVSIAEAVTGIVRRLH